MKALFFLFNIEGYGEFFSGITPLRPFNFVSIQSIERSMAFTFNLTTLHHKQGNQNNTKACSL